eukprot:TRINITY_DN37754_c0_g1_i1.p1 TRINITY_DN37754_c0_g1~~TRINITY_DN37754_c0_g1_i1.p1  ORF type:complete len:169 (+),score=41.03 TRINITY_DN37754_c0_g1_i1:209-715(+)
MTSNTPEGIAGGVAAFEDLQPFLTTSPFLQTLWKNNNNKSNTSATSFVSTLLAGVHFPKPTPLRTVVYQGNDATRNKLSLQWLLVSILSDASLLPLSSATKIRIPRLSHLSQRVKTIHAACSVLLLDTSSSTCLLYTSDAADEEDSVDLGGRRIITKKHYISQYQTHI